MGKILADAALLKKYASDFMHPEAPIESEKSFSMGRNYFSRASALEQESKEEAEERAQILADAMLLKKLAVDYLHPEAPVKTMDPFATGRNFFTRPSAVVLDPV